MLLAVTVTGAPVYEGFQACTSFIYARGPPQDMYLLMIFRFFVVTASSRSCVLKCDGNGGRNIQSAAAKHLFTECEIKNPQTPRRLVHMETRVTIHWRNYALTITSSQR